MQGSSETKLVPQTAEEILAESGERRREIPSQPAQPEPVSVFETDQQTPDVGSTVLAEGRMLVEQRRFADAARVLESAERLRPDDPEVLGLVAVANANAGKNKPLVRSALGRLSEEFQSRALTWRTVSDVAIARFQFDPAQKAARTAVQHDPDDPANWTTLAASYAGNGWFDEAADCLNSAAQVDPTGGYRPNSPADLTFAQWQVGRAVNYWALTRTYLALAGAVAFVYIGLLGVALVLSAPMLIREVRVRRLPEPFRSLADRSWATEHKLRVINAVSVLGVLVLWAFLFSMRG